MKMEQGKVYFPPARGWLLKSESDIQPRYEIGDPLVLARHHRQVPLPFQEQVGSSAARRHLLPKREPGLWPEKVSTNAIATNRGRR